MSVLNPAGAVVPSCHHRDIRNFPSPFLVWYCADSLHSDV